MNSLRLAPLLLYSVVPLLISPLVAFAAPEAADDAARTATAVEALSRLQGIDINQNPKIKEAVLKILDRTRGTASFLKLVQQFKLSDQDAGLLEVAVRNSTNETGVEAMRLLLKKGDFPLLKSALDGTNNQEAVKAAEALGYTEKKEAVPLLLPLLDASGRDLELRKQAVRSLARTSDGASATVRLVKEDKLATDLRLTASSELNRVRWPEIRAEAASLLPPAQGKNAQPLPPLAELLKMSGDPGRGAKMFANPSIGCMTCHQVKGQGTDFGPNLTEVGSKLGKDALYEAILEPSAGISFGFETWQLQLKSGDEAYGLIVSETPGELAMKAVGGIVTHYKKSEIARREQLKVSIMPVGLQQGMTAQELVDLVEYLYSLKKGG